MKLNLGKYKVILLLFVFVLKLSASTYEWSVKANKNSAYVNEAIHLEYTCTYDDKADLYAIDFNPTVDNDEYSIKILREDERIRDNRKIDNYELILFVKKEGEFNLALETLMKKTNKDSIVNGILGRDNLNYEEFLITKIKQKSIKLNILKTDERMVGEFVLDIKADKSEVKAFSPYHLELSIKGIGDFQLLEDIVFQIEGVEIFSESAYEDIQLTKDGYKGVWKKKFAFVSEKEFTIPSWKLSYFDPKDKITKELVYEGVEVKVTTAKYKKEELLDEEAKPLVFSKEYLYYLLTFIAGFLLAKVKFRREKKENSKDENFCKKIEKTDSIDELLFLLISKDSRKYQTIITMIESKKETSLKGIKKQLCM
jgi:hypothetical protein